MMAVGGEEPYPPPSSQFPPSLLRIAQQANWLEVEKEYVDAYFAGDIYRLHYLSILPYVRMYVCMFDMTISSLSAGCPPEYLLCSRKIARRRAAAAAAVKSILILILIDLLS